MIRKSGYRFSEEIMRKTKSPKRQKSARRFRRADNFIKTSLRRGLGDHVDDLDAAVDRVHRRVRIFRLGLAKADGHEIGAVETKLLGQVFLDRIGATLGEVLIIGLAADRIGMTGDHEGRTLQAGVRQRLAEFLYRRHRTLADIGRVVVESDFEIDLRLGRGEFGDLLTLAERERARL